MAKAKKLPSGNWRVLVYSHTDPVTKKKRYESFTADTRAEAEYLAAEFSRNKNEKRNAINLTVRESMDRYIESKAAVLSPSTVRIYKKMAGAAFPAIRDVKLRNLTAEKIQSAVNEDAKEHAPKTVKNRHGLLSASLEMFYPDFKLRTTLPQKIKAELYIPTDTDVKALLKHVEGKSIEIPILLASAGSMRRSEIPALLPEDVTDLGVRVCRAMVRDEKNKWVIKQPKTNAGYRTVPLPQEIIKKLKGRNPVCELNPGQITRYFQKAVEACGLPHFRFHDLRHYWASVLHALGIPDKYIMEYGGWNTDNVLKTVYQHTLADRKDDTKDKVINFFDALTGDEKQKDNTKCNTSKQKSSV